MVGKTKGAALSVASDRTIALIRECPLRPIRSEAELSRAIAAVDRLTDVESPGDEEQDYLAVLANLIADYEDEHEDDDVSPAEDMLRHLIDSRGVTQAEVGMRGSGLSDATISHILVGHRPPSRKAIAALASYFKVDPAVFL